MEITRTSGISFCQLSKAHVNLQLSLFKQQNPGSGLLETNLPSSMKLSHTSKILQYMKGSHCFHRRNIVTFLFHFCEINSIHYRKGAFRKFVTELYRFFQNREGANLCSKKNISKVKWEVPKKAQKIFRKIISSAGKLKKRGVGAYLIQD